ncbi:MAG: protein phosphatase 2C domain-containing protein, partial [Acidimicrobiales bacterium]
MVLGRPSAAASNPARLRPAVVSASAGYRADGGDTGGWAVRAASVPGVSHRLAGTPNQDSFGWVAVDGALVVAVADGVGSLEGADTASAAAVSGVCSVAAAWLAEGKTVGWPLV